MGKAWTSSRRLNQLSASLSLFVNEGFELPGLQCPAQLTPEDSTLKSVSSQACQAVTQNFLTTLFPPFQVVLTYLYVAV